MSCVWFLVPCFVAGCSWGWRSLVPVFSWGRSGLWFLGLSLHSDRCLNDDLCLWLSLGWRGGSGVHDLSLLSGLSLGGDLVFLTSLSGGVRLSDVGLHSYLSFEGARCLLRVMRWWLYTRGCWGSSLFPFGCGRSLGVVVLPISSFFFLCSQGLVSVGSRFSGVRHAFASVCEGAFRSGFMLVRFPGYGWGVDGGGALKGSAYLNQCETCELNSTNY